MKGLTMSTSGKLAFRMMVCGLLIFFGTCSFGCAKPSSPSGKDSPSVKELLDKLEKGDFAAKLYALDELGKLGAKAKPAVPTLIIILEDDKSPIPGAAAAVKEETIAHPEDANPTLRSSAAATLGDIGPDAKPAIPALLKNLKDKDKYVRCVSADALAGIGSKEERVLSALKDALNDSVSEVRIDAAEALNELDPDNPDALSALIKLLKDKDPETRRDAASVLEQIQSTKINTVVPALLRAIKDPDENVRSKAAQSLGSICEKAMTVVPALVERLEKDKSSHVRIQAAQALQEYGPEAKLAIPALSRVMKEDPVSRVQKSAAQAIRRINTMPAKRGRKGAEEELKQLRKEHPEFEDVYKLAKRRRGIKYR
jgi:HEAT repeat protein